MTVAQLGPDRCNSVQTELRLAPDRVRVARNSSHANSAIDRRPNLKGRIVTALEALNFRTVDAGRDDTVLALNIAMVGPVSNRVLAPRGS